MRKLLKTLTSRIRQNEQHDQRQMKADRFLLYTDIKYDQENILNSTIKGKRVNVTWCVYKVFQYICKLTNANKNAIFLNCFVFEPYSSLLSTDQESLFSRYPAR